MTAPLFARVAILGFGLIGSSLARAIRQRGLATEIVNGCGEHCTPETLNILMREVGDAVVAHARQGIVRDDHERKLLEGFWEHEPPDADPQPHKGRRKP